MTLAATTTHPWIGSLQAELDALEGALLRGDAPGVEQASAALQAVLQQAPAAAGPDATLQQDTQSAAQRFARLRQAVLRANAQNHAAAAHLRPHGQALDHGRRRPRLPDRLSAHPPPPAHRLRRFFFAWRGRTP